jgi:translocation and assembly module TamA
VSKAQELLNNAPPLLQILSTGAHRFYLFIGSILLIFSLFASPSFGEEVIVIISGLEGKELINAQKSVQIPSGIVENGQIDNELLGLFVKGIPNKIADSLKPFGYYHAIAKTQAERQSDEYRVAVFVEKGEPITISRVHVDIVGPGAPTASFLDSKSSFPFKAADILRQDIYEDWKKDLTTKAANLGYLDGDFTEHRIAIRTTENKAEIDLVFDTGHQYFFNGTVFSGVVSYPVDFMRSFLAFKTGDVFSYTKLGQSQANLNNSERFRNVLITADKSMAHDYQLPVEIEVEEAPRAHMRIGGGYGTDTGPRFILRYQHLNMMGKAHEFQTALDMSQYKQGVAAKYMIPGTTDYRSHTGLKLAWLREDVDTYTTRSISLEAEREQSLGQGRIGNIFLRLLREESEVGYERTISFLVLPGVRFTASDYDNLIRPRKGYRVSAEIKGTSTYLGSNQTLLQSVADAAFAYPLGADYTFFGRMRVGWTLQQESILDLPASLRFFAGGDRSVRGYAYQSLGPKDSDDNVIGGKNVFIGSLEVERSIGKDWGIAAFFDAGNAFDDVSRITLYRGAGLGVRYYTRVGPISLDIARPFDRGYPVVRIHVTLGFGI